MDILSLIPSAGGLAQTVVAFVVALSVIVAVHEYGHYIVGRWTGIHADVFSLGFGPRIAAWTDRRGTRWQIAALPFGGYVKFRGDADAASVTPDATAFAALPETERRHTMLGAPLWARALTVAAGPAFNFVLATAIFAGYFMVSGTAIDRPVIGTLVPLPGVETALRPGDRITAVAGTPTPDNAAFADAIEGIPPAPSVAYTVERDGAETTLDGPYPQPPLAQSVQPLSAADAAGLRAGDVITAIDGRDIYAFRELQDATAAADGRPMALTVWEDGETRDVTLSPRRTDVPTADGTFESRWLIGLGGGLFFEHETRATGPVEALTGGVAQTWFIVRTSLSGLGHMITGAISTCNMSGPLGIAETSGATARQGLGAFVWFIAALSTAVGLMNLFPIPVLDGGHLVFHAFEAVSGRPPSDRALRVLMGAGITFILGLMAFALTNDLFCP